MRTAICFNGLVGSTHGKSHDLQGDFKKCFEISSPLYREHIIDKNDTDVFVHSWSTVLENEIINTYKPKKHLIEPQIIFDIPTYVGGDDNRTQSHYSRWCSAKKVIDLKNEYEKENNFKYDCVMLARFDLAWQSDLIFDEYDHKYFWTGMWPKKILDGRTLHDLEYWQLRETHSSFGTVWHGYPHTDDGLLGTWFFSNSENMNNFSRLFDNLNEYTKLGNCPNDSASQVSNHRLSLYHLKQINLIDNLKFCEKNWHDDFGTVRRRYYKTK
jgi:hypothetical protein